VVEKRKLKFAYSADHEVEKISGIGVCLLSELTMPTSPNSGVGLSGEAVLTFHMRTAFSPSIAKNQIPMPDNSPV
jgi:hypothetical protein